MIDKAVLDAAVRLYLPRVRAVGILSEDDMVTALIRTAYWRLKKQADAEEKANDGRPTEASRDREEDRAGLPPEAAPERL